MKWSKLSRTTAFRLSAIYLLLFLSCFIALGGGVFFLTERTLGDQLKKTLTGSIEQLERSYKDVGIPELVKEITKREDNTAWNAPDYALIDPSGKRLAGTLPTHNYKSGFEIFSGPQEADNPSESQTIYAEAVYLKEGYVLVAGEDGDYIEDFGETLVEGFAWSGFLVSFLGLSCGSLIGRSFLRRAETLTSSAHRIIAGDISHRLSVSDLGDELDELAILINRTLDQINKLVEEVRQVSSDIAHDLRTPISRLRQSLEETQRQPLSADQYRDNIGSAIIELDTILATFSGLLRIAQIEASARRHEFRPVNLGTVASRVTDALSPVADESGRHLSLKTAENLILAGDRELLTQMVFNLVENAIRHTPPGSRIDLILQRSDDTCELVVTDNGPGIPEEYMDKVFQRFYRLEKSRSTPGNGLGLSIVKAIAEVHGGVILLSDNRPGLRVMVRFPLTPINN